MLPAELVDHTVELMDEKSFPVSWEEAVKMRKKLMDKHRCENEEKTDDMMEVSLRPVSMVIPPPSSRDWLSNLAFLFLQEMLCYGSP